MRTDQLELVKPREKSTERRGKIRFPIRRELRFKVLDNGSIVASGMGYTHDIGSTGVGFLSDGAMKVGSFVELSISWPVLLDDSCPMRMIVFGRVVRSGGECLACTIDKYEFRTQSRARQADPAARNDSMLQRWADSQLKEGMKLRAATA